MAVILQLGSTGADVRALQQRLNERGAQPPLVVDGMFGPKTHTAVVAFQTAHGLAPDGIVGPRTGAALDLNPDPRNLTEHVPLPAEISPGLSPAQQTTMLQALGVPGALTDQCSEPTSPRVRELVVHEDVGPFAVRGLRPAVEALRRIFTTVQQQDPALFAVLGTAGMLCCRRVRRTTPPPSPNFSNHSWGTAIDLTIDGVLDPRADHQALRGLVLLHPYFTDERFYWGAGFRGSAEDAMHFEVSNELVRDWTQQGVLVP